MCGWCRRLREDRWGDDTAGIDASGGNVQGLSESCRRGPVEPVPDDISLPDGHTSATAHPVRGASVLVAGATGGIGGALADELHHRGAVLTLVSRSSDRLEQMTVPGRCIALDLRTRDACARAVDAAIAHAGGLDVVINAVGVVAFGPLQDLAVDVMEEVFLTNTFLPIMLAQAALARMAPGGAFVNISGVIAEQNLPGMAVYGASKAAVRSFDEALAREARRAKIRVIDARPPHTETGLAGRPIEGEAPKMPPGLAPDHVALVICDALEQGVNDLPSTRFAV
jgi:cyclic-di-GMP-binding biofilm dispersal mediator protein